MKGRSWWRERRGTKVPLTAPSSARRNLMADAYGHVARINSPVVRAYLNHLIEQDEEKWLRE